MLGVILEPHSNVKNPMVRKPVHMIKPRVVTLQKSLRNSLEKRRQELSRSDTSTSPSKDVTASLLTYGEGHFGKILHFKVQDFCLSIRWKGDKISSDFCCACCAANPLYTTKYSQNDRSNIPLYVCFLSSNSKIHFYYKQSCNQA